jgi:ElaB/YqjD/DUF883 family membrane-anchored ribosome-binding protein
VSRAKSVTEAKAEAIVARGKLTATLKELQVRTRPKRLVNDAIEEVRTRSVDLAGDAGQFARRRPAAVAAGTAAGLALVLHRPLWRLGRKLLGRADETTDDDLGLDT